MLLIPIQPANLPLYIILQYVYNKHSLCHIQGVHSTDNFRVLAVDIKSIKNYHRTWGRNHPFNQKCSLSYVEPSLVDDNNFQKTQDGLMKLIIDIFTFLVIMITTKKSGRNFHCTRQQYALDTPYFGLLLSVYTVSLIA